MGKYLLYTGIIFSILGLIGSIFVFFYFDIKACFSEWRAIKKNEMGKAVKEDLLTQGNRRKRSSGFTDDSDDTRGDMPGIFGTDGSKSEGSSDIFMDGQVVPMGSIRFGEDIIQASLTDVLDDKDEDVLLSEGADGLNGNEKTNDETDALIEEKGRWDETDILVDPMSPLEETDMLDEGDISTETCILTETEIIFPNY